jgi:hypothetical protein
MGGGPFPLGAAMGSSALAPIAAPPEARGKARVPDLVSHRHSLSLVGRVDRRGPLFRLPLDVTMLAPLSRELRPDRGEALMADSVTTFSRSGGVAWRWPPKLVGNQRCSRSRAGSAGLTATGHVPKVMLNQGSVG